MSTVTGSFRHFTAQPGTAPLLDATIAVAAFGGTLLAVVHGGGVPDAAVPLDAIRVALAGCACLPLVLWRRSPVAVFAATALASVLLAGTGSAGGFTPGPATALFLLAASRTRQAPWTRLTTAVVAGLFAAYAGALLLSAQAVVGIELLHAALAWAVGWFAGERSRLRREQILQLHERAERAEHDALRDRQLAVAEERTRIARDLHDSAGHAINVIAVRAGAARLHQDPQRSVAALTAIEDLARQTAADIDHIVGRLRDPEPDGHVEAPAGLASLATLVAHHTDAGLRVRLTQDGDLGGLSRTTDQAVYRIVQEALTNAARHGTGTADIELAFSGSEAALTVTNPLSPGFAPAARGGHGLVGMQERATLLGGTLTAEPTGGVFRVHARIPSTGQRR
jgi:signal transduction histidine kinase